MWRSLFLAMGLFSCVLGAECLLIDKAVLASKSDNPVANLVGHADEVVPPDWAPWSLMSGGAVVILYSFTLPQKLKGGG